MTNDAGSFAFGLAATAAGEMTIAKRPLLSKIAVPLSGSPKKAQSGRC
jgi:hypothetical protein